MKNGEVTADLFDRKRTAQPEQLRSVVFDQASAFENLWQNIRQTKVATAKGRSCAPEPHHKQTAYRHYRRKVRSFADDARCLAALGAYRNSDRVKAGYIQDAGTFLNQFEEWIPMLTDEPSGDIQNDANAMDAFRKRAATERANAPDLPWHRVSVAFSAQNVDAQECVALTWQMGQNEDTIEVAVPNQPFVDWIREVWGTELRACLDANGLTGTHVQFVVTP